jgi:hypothetical protein
MMMDELILLLNIREDSIMNQVKSMAEKEDFISSNIMTIRKEDFVHCTILN